MTTDDAAAVYAAEDVWATREFLAGIRFGDFHEVQPFYVDVAARFREAGDHVYPPTVMARKGSLAAHYDPATKTVHLPPYDKGGVWALNTATAIHEFAHHLVPDAGHGPQFRDAMIRILKVLGWDHTILEKCYAEAGLVAGTKGGGITDKVGKLLLHADRAGTPEEQKIYIEKAEALAAEHSINLALVRKRAADAGGERDRPTASTLFSLAALPSTTYRNLAVELATAITQAHTARITIHGKSEYLTFYGFPEDIHLSELMLKRVTPMMFEASDAYLKTPEHKASGVAGVSARITFCKSFAWEIEARLRAAVQRTEQEIQETLEITDGSTGTSTALALKEKAVEVKDFIDYEWKRRGVRGSWTGSSTSSFSHQASSAGRRSAREANLFGRKELG